jgi:DNA-binding NarL/FixJ family response regulator
MSPIRNPANILIVDDDPNIHLLLERVLRKINPDRIITSFQNGKDALMHISNEIKKGECIYDIAIIDLMLPVIPGPDINAILKYKCPSTISIALTNGEDQFGFKDMKSFKFDYAVSKGWIFENMQHVPCHIMRDGLYDRSLQDVIEDVLEHLK